MVKMQLFKYWGLCALMSVAGSLIAASSQVQIENAGFESTEAPATAAWLAGDSGWNITPGGCELANDASEGVQAAHLTQGFLRYQIDTAELQGRALSVTFSAKGTGNLVFGIAAFYQEDGVWQRTNLQSSAQGGLALSQEYQDYTVDFSAIPSGTIYVTLEIGDYNSKDWYIDDVCVSYQEDLLPLENAGFESTETPATAAWLAGDSGWAISPGGCELVNDASEGAQAAHLTQGFLRYQIYTAELQDSSLSVTFSAKGSGNLVFGIAAFYQEDGVWQRTNLQSNAQGGLHLTTQQYLPYTVKFSPVPVGTIYIQLEFGDYNSKDWYIDDVKVSYQDEPFDLEEDEITVSPDAYFTGRGELSEELVNIAPYAKIRTNPFSIMPCRITDGIMGTGLTFEEFPSAGAKTIEFLYDEPQTISSIRLSIPPTDFAFYADTTGDGQYETLLKIINGGQQLSYWNREEWPWLKVDLPEPLDIYGLLYIDISQEDVPLMEFQIVSPEIPVAPTRPILLENAGFESTEPPATAAWLAGDSGWNITPGGCELVNDASEGVQAAHLTQGFLRYQIDTAELQGRALSVTFSAKGTGNLVFGIAAFYQDENEVWHRTNLQSSAQGGVALSQEYQDYTVDFSAIPSGTIYVTLEIGDYNSKDWYIDDVYVSYYDEDLLPLENAGFESTETPATAAWLAGDSGWNITPGGCELVNDASEGAQAAHLTQGFLRYQIDTAELQGRALSVTFSAKGTGNLMFGIAAFYQEDGVWHRTNLQSSAQGGVALSQEYQDYTVDFSTIPYGTIYVTLEIGDYNSKDWYIDDVYVSCFIPLDVPVLAEGENIPVPTATEAQKYLQGFTIEPWMFQCPQLVQTRRTGVEQSMADWQPLVDLFADYSLLNANFMLLFPPKTCENVAGRTGTFAWDVMWPSSVWRWYSDDNLLEELCTEARNRNISIFSVIRYRYFREDLPYPTGSELKTYGLYGNNVNQSISEMAAAGVDAASLCLDEEYVSASYPIFYFQMKTIPPDADEQLIAKLNYENERADVRREAFKNRFDLVDDIFPETPSDTELYRQYVIFYFEQIAERMYDSTMLAKNANSNAKTLAAFATTDKFNNRLAKTSDHDIFGFGADIDYMWCDPYFTQEDPWGWYHPSYMAQVLRASSAKRHAGLTLNYNWGGLNPEQNPLCAETYPLICYVGSVLGGAMNGASAFDFWRYNYACDLDPVEGGRQGVEKAFAMLDTLAAWGGKDAQIPKDIAVLRSRASEDWWQLKVLYGDWDGSKTVNAKGFSYYKWIASQFLRNGYPFETYFLDHPEAYGNISQFKTIILPFPYSMSEEALSIIESAINNGTKVIALGAKGETDEMGIPYPEPLLSELIDTGEITYFDADILRDANFHEVGNSFRGLLNNKLGDQRTLKLERYGKEIQAGCLEKSPYEKLVVLINWSGYDTFVDLGIRMPAGNYRVLQRDLEKVNEMTLNGENTMSASELENIRVEINSGEAKILLFYPAE